MGSTRSKSKRYELYYIKLRKVLLVAYQCFVVEIRVDVKQLLFRIFMTTVVPPNYEHLNVLSEIVEVVSHRRYHVPSLATAPTYLVRGQWSGLSKIARSPALLPSRVSFGTGMV